MKLTWEKKETKQGWKRRVIKKSNRKGGKCNKTLRKKWKGTNKKKEGKADKKTTKPFSLKQIGVG
jgi:hypothetical protein